jgi:HSP20 family molecular chaperone IbpA
MSELPQHYIPVVPRVERSIRPRYFYEQSDRGILVGMFLKTLRGFDNLCRLSRNKPLKPGDIYEVSVDMNGFKADEFAVTVKGNTVYVNATSDQYASRTDKVHYQMIREFEVPNVVDFNFASATYGKSY